MPDGFTFADTEAKRLLAILSRVKLLPVQQPSSVMDTHFVSNHWLVSSMSWTLHDLWRQASILIECQVLQYALRFVQKTHLKVWQQSTLMTPWSLLGVTSMPFAVNTAVVEWPSIGRSWSVVISARGVWRSRTAKEMKKHVMITMRNIALSQVPSSG